MGNIYEKQKFTIRILFTTLTIRMNIENVKQKCVCVCVVTLNGKRNSQSSSGCFHLFVFFPLPFSFCLWIAAAHTARWE